MMRAGVKVLPQSDTHGGPPVSPLAPAPKKENKLKLGPYISPEFERTPEGKGLPDVCSYTISLLEDNQLWLDFESKSKINSSKWHVEGPYEETSDSTIQYKIEGRPFGGGPAVGSVLSLDMDLKAGTITFDGQTCAFKGEITGVEMENVSQGKPEPKKAPAAPAAPEGKPEPEPKAEPKKAQAAPAAAGDAPKAEEKASPAAPGDAPKAEKAAPAAPAAGDALTLAELQDEQIWKPRGVDASKRETYLSDSEFQSLFGVDKAQFAAMPKWKQETAKKKHKLF